jgi:hypothetical protein
MMMTMTKTFYFKTSMETYAFTVFANTFKTIAEKFNHPKNVEYCTIIYGDECCEPTNKRLVGLFPVLGIVTSSTLLWRGRACCRQLPQYMSPVELSLGDKLVKCKSLLALHFFFAQEQIVLSHFSFSKLSNTFATTILLFITHSDCFWQRAVYSKIL